tara:strand:- start:268 stop:456 length:189 start_codon:yes stop_codon:yes gene_type:complete
MERYCVVCKEEIFESMGVVLARDFIDFIDGRRKDMRELCGKDNLRRMSLGFDIDAYLEKYAK